MMKSTGVLMCDILLEELDMILLKGTEIIIDEDSNVAYDGHNHFDIFPGEYRLYMN